MICLLTLRRWCFVLAVIAGMHPGAVVVGEETNTTSVVRSGPRKPCIVLLLADGLGADELGCYGGTTIRTPNIDALAGAGARFTRFYAASAQDEAARVALLTGSTSQAHLLASIPTLAERLKAANYHTAYLGVWGMGGFKTSHAAHQRGFEETAVYGSRAHAQDLYTSHLFRKDAHSGFEGREMLKDNYGGKRDGYLPDLLTHAAVQFCRQNHPTYVNRYRPFLLVVSYPVPAALSSKPQRVPESGAYATSAWSAQQKARAEAITRFDEHVGEILEELSRKGTDQNTILLVASVHGSRGKESLAPLKAVGPDTGLLSEQRLRVPLIAHWPFWIRSGKTTDLLSSGEDIVPTLMEAADLEVPADGTGISFLPVLQGREQTNRHAFLQWDVPGEAGEHEQALRQGQWKLVRSGDPATSQLYDLAGGSGLQENVADKHPDVVARLTDLMDARTSTGTN